MEIIIVKDFITRNELERIAQEGFGDMVKAVIDVKLEIMALGGELHMDELELLAEKENSSHMNAWGINLYPKKTGDGFIEFDSMVNLKPAFGNRTRAVDNLEAKKKIIEIIDKLVK